MFVVLLGKLIVPCNESQAKKACEPMVCKLLGNVSLRKLWRECKAFLGMFTQLPKRGSAFPCNSTGRAVGESRYYLWSKAYL